jgi:hypothetical protein
MCHPVDADPGVRGGDPAFVSARSAGQSHVYPGDPVGAGRMAQHGQDGSHTGQRPSRLDGLDPAGGEVGAGASDVIFQHDHEWLGGRDCGRGGVRGGDEDMPCRGREDDRRQRVDPPAKAEGSGGVGTGAGHPVNCEGPGRGWRTAAAQAR